VDAVLRLLLDRRVPGGAVVRCRGLMGWVLDRGFVVVVGTT